MFVVPVICLVLISYFIYHANQGRFGMQAQSTMLQREGSLKNDLAQVRDQRNILAARVALMRIGTMERDMLDEQARFHLNLVDESEIVIYRKQ